MHFLEFIQLLHLLGLVILILQVLSPYSSEDAKGLLKAAIRDDNPGINFEVLDRFYNPGFNFWF